MIVRNEETVIDSCSAYEPNPLGGTWVAHARGNGF